MATVGVVGGGAAGLGATFTALEAGHKVVLFDRNPDLGGRCRTHEWHGEWLIRGAAAFIGNETEIVDISKKLGIYERNNIQSSREEMEFTVLHPKKGHAFLGSFDVPSILKSDVIPFAEKAKLATALPKMIQAFMSADETDPTSVVSMDDINACEYFRKYSPTFVDYILEPIMNMYCGYSEDDYSMAWLGWLMASPRSWSASQWTFADRGVGKLTQTIQDHLVKHTNCELRLGADVTEIILADHAPQIRYRTGNEQATESVDKLIVAVPGTLVPGIIPGLPEDMKRFFEEVQYVPHHIVHMLIDNPEEGVPFSLLVPTCEGFHAASNFWLKPSAADRSKTLFYGEVKGRFAAANRGKDDRFFAEAVWKDACKAEPRLSNCKNYEWHVQRNEIALCSRRKGYTTALKAFREADPLKNVRFAGDYLINSTVGQSMRSGIDAVLDLLGEHESYTRRLSHG